MVYGTLQSVEPAKDSIDPALHLVVRVRYRPVDEPLLSFTGRLKLEGKQFLGGVEPGYFSGGSYPFSSYALLPQGTPPALPEYDTTVEFLFRLSRREVDAIHRVRDIDAQADIHLALAVQAQTFSFGLRAFPIEFLESNTQQGKKSILAFHPDRTSLPGDILIARHDESPVRLMTSPLPDITVSIPSSHWVRDFAPVFGVGRFLTVNIPKPEQLATADGDLAKRVNEAVSALHQMELDIQKGEWTQCAEDSRPLLELLNRAELIRPLLVTAGLPEANAESLLTGLQQVYQYAHAFHHRTERDGKVVEGGVNANPEDAYLAFATAAGLLNLIGRKISRKSSR
jgi:hypothetical protein